MKTSIPIIILAAGILSFGLCNAQTHYLPWFNVGYLNSLNIGCENCDISRGKSVRIGIQTDGRWGAFVGYAWYDTELATPSTYEDSGKDYILGISFRGWKRGHLTLHATGGIALERFRSQYPTTGQAYEELSVVPQFGALVNYRFVNVYLGMGSTAFNAGVGLTLY